MKNSFTRFIFSISFFLGIFATKTASAQCHTSFTFAQISNTLTVQFTDASTTPSPAIIATWQWNFGDGTTSADQNPHHTFAHDGTFHVCLITHDNAGCTSDACFDVVVTAISPACHSSFTFGQIANTLTIEFTDASTSGNTITSWLWEFGDGTSSADQNPHHTFTHDGTFHVCLTIHDNTGCSNQFCHDVIVTAATGSCHTLFTFAQIPNTLTIEFADASTTASPAIISSWQWNFGDGTTSADQNPHHTFPHDGTFHVCLITHDNLGCSSDVCHDVIVTGTGVPVSCHALFTVTNTNNPLEIHFNDASTSPNTITSWLWDFGDGATSHDQNIGHTYTHDGTYHVCLTIHDNTGCTNKFVTVE